MINPQQLRKILKAIFEHWGQASLRLFEDQERVCLRKFHQEMKVTTASLINGFRFFIEIPVYDDNQRFTLHRAYNAPIFSGNSSVGSIYDDMPEYVALRSRKTAYISLMKNEVEPCIQGTVAIFPLRKPIYPVENAKGKISCVINQLVYEGQSLTSCEQRAVPWKGPRLYQYEYQRWLYSGQEAMIIDHICASIFGIFELQPNGRGFSDNLRIAFPFSTTKAGKISVEESSTDYGNLSFLDDFETSLNFQSVIKTSSDRTKKKKSIGYPYGNYKAKKVAR